MKKIVYIDEKYFKLFFDKSIKLENIDIFSIYNVENLIVNYDRICIIGNRKWKECSDIMKIKGAIVVPCFTESDAIDSPQTNCANICILDLLEFSIQKIIWLASTWLSQDTYKPDGFHDKYVQALKEWG